MEKQSNLIRVRLEKMGHIFSLFSLGEWLVSQMGKESLSMDRNTFNLALTFPDPKTQKDMEIVG